MDTHVSDKVREAVSKIVADLKSIGLDPYVDIGNNSFNIIVPVEQLARLIESKIPQSVYKYVNVNVMQMAVGMNSYLIIRIKKKV